MPAPTRSVLSIPGVVAGGEDDGGVETRLTVELVPSTCWYTNVRSHVPKAVWDRLRRQVAAEAGDRCEICGGRGRRWPVECHEVVALRRRSEDPAARAARRSLSRLPRGQARRPGLEAGPAAPGHHPTTSSSATRARRSSSEARSGGRRRNSPIAAHPTRRPCRLRCVPAEPLADRSRVDDLFSRQDEVGGPLAWEAFEGLFAERTEPRPVFG